MAKFLQNTKFLELDNQRIELTIINADISLLCNINCIVNCTGPKFQHYNGVSKSITDAAGNGLVHEFNNYLAQNSFLDQNSVFITQSYNLTNFDSILHICSPFTANSLEPIYDKLFDTCFNQLNLASIAVPIIGTGQCGFKLDDSIEPLINSLRKISLSKKCQVIIANNLKDKYLESVQIIKNLLEPKNNQLDEDCPICLEKIKQPKLLDICGHVFCRVCIEQCLKIKKECPYCKQSYGKQIGTQPPGQMSYRSLNTTLPGFDQSVKTIEITYSFQGGVQGPEHPNPGVPYSGTTRVAYLPDNSEGKNVLSLLKKAFEQKLIFTIGQSRTTGQNNVITWDDIHHKTNISGGPAFFGYPDPNYIQRVTYELALKGIK